MIQTCSHKADEGEISVFLHIIACVLDSKSRGKLDGASRVTFENTSIL